MSNEGSNELLRFVQHSDEFEKLGETWHELLTDHQTPLLTFEWYSSCAAAFTPPAKLCVLVAFHDNHVTGIAPLMVTRGRLGDRLELLGSSVLCEPGGFLYKNEQSLHEILEGMLALKMPLRILRVRESSSDNNALRRMLEGNDMFFIERKSFSPWIRLNGEWKDFESRMSSQRRSGLRRSLRRLHQEGDVVFQFVSPGPGDVDNYLGEVFAVESSGWKGRTGTAVARREDTRRFFNLYCSSTSKSGILRLGFLKVNRKVIAAMIGVEYAQRFWILKIGYDEAWARCSPGILLIHESIHQAFLNNLEAYEFLGNNEPWIHMWTQDLHSYVSYYVYPVSIQGLIQFSEDASVALTEKVRRQFFRGTR